MSAERRKRHARVMARQKKCEAGVRKLCREADIKKAECKQLVSDVCPKPRFYEKNR